MGAHLLGTGIYIPPNRVSAAEFIPQEWEEEYRNKVVGIDEIPIAAPHEHASTLATKASLDALERNNFDPRDLDAVIYCGLGVNDYGFWSPAAKVQYEIGAENAFAFDIYQGCANVVLAFKIARDMLDANSEMNSIMIATGCRSGEWVEGRTTGNTFYSDGGASIIVTKQPTGWQIGPTISKTNGYFHDVFHAVAGGTVAPTGDVAMFRVQNQKKQQEDLRPVFIQNYVEQIEAMLQSCEGPVYVNLMNYNRWLLEKLKEQFSNRVQGWMNNVQTYGHMGPCDTILNFHLANQEFNFEKGAAVINVVSGIGLSWNSCRFERI